METLIVYSLVILFFLFLLIFVLAVLPNHPYSEPAPKGQAQVPTANTPIVYMVLSILVVALFVLGWVSQRKQISS